MAQTFTDLTDIVALGAHMQGMGVSPKDVGWIISTFLEGVIHSEGTPLHPAIEKFLQTMADQAGSIEDE